MRDAITEQVEDSASLLRLNYHLLERFIDGKGRAGFLLLSNRHINELGLRPTLVISQLLKPLQLRNYCR